ncbi:MAG: universal stress protein [Gemmatimonadaceae bacterium]|nr:universal stress protein [Gemmatimonadaceae bacterium]
MSQAARPYTAGRAPIGAEEPSGPVLVAIKGAGDGEAPLRAAQRIAEQQGRELEIVTVLELLPLYALDAGSGPTLTALEEEERAAALAAARTEVRATLGEDAAARVRAVAGQPARTIARLAHEWHAWLIVLGLGAHEARDRIFGRETALQTLRLADRPILMVAPGASGAPEHVVAAVDFSAASVRAVEIASHLAAPGATLTLVHVQPTPDAGRWRPARSAWIANYRRRTDELFHRLQASLTLPPTMHVETVTRIGRPADEVLAVAAERGADLVVSGSRSHGLVARLFVGSVATALLRRAPCSLLISPEPAAAAAHEIERTLTGVTESTARTEWPAIFHAFARRNAGRRATIEVDDPVTGTQLQETGLALLDASYDPGDGRAEIVLGDPAAAPRLLMRAIGGVGAVTLFTGEDGRDRALRIAHGPGQTMVTLID